MSKDVSHETLTHSFTTTFDYYPEVIEFAKDAVKGHTEDYYFFQYDDDEYVLIFSDDMQISNFGCYAHDSTSLVFWRRDGVASTSSSSVSLSGTNTEVGVTPNVSNITLSGSITSSEDSYYWQMFVVSTDDLQVSNGDGNLCYSSLGDYTPRLVEGVSYYAFAAFCLALGIIGFRLLDFIFKRIY